MPLHTRLARRLLALAEDFGAEVTASQEDLAVFVGATREKRQPAASGLAPGGHRRSRPRPVRVVDDRRARPRSEQFHH
jgi:hypothetical protein